MVFKENKPIYKQIADRICDEILTMEYRDESRIPSVREHAATLDVNVNTIVRAYDYLLELDILGDELPEFLARLTQLDIPIEEIVEIYRSMK